MSKGLIAPLGEPPRSDSTRESPPISRVPENEKTTFPPVSCASIITAADAFSMDPPYRRAAVKMDVAVFQTIVRPSKSKWLSDHIYHGFVAGPVSPVQQTS